MYMTV